MVKQVVKQSLYRNLCQKMHRIEQRRINIKTEWIKQLIDFQWHVRWIRETRERYKQAVKYQVNYRKHLSIRVECEDR